MEKTCTSAKTIFFERVSIEIDKPEVYCLESKQAKVITFSAKSFSISKRIKFKSGVSNAAVKFSEGKFIMFGKFLKERHSSLCNFPFALCVNRPSKELRSIWHSCVETRGPSCSLVFRTVGLFGQHPTSRHGHRKYKMHQNHVCLP